MQAVDKEVLSQVLTWLKAGTPCWLATVVATWGSSPRPVGSLMAAAAGANLVGSLSGGCVEDDLVERLIEGTIAAERPEFYQYGVTPEETERLGLPCGGHLDVVVEPMRPTPAIIDHFEEIVLQIQARKCVSRRLNMLTGAVSSTVVEAHQPLVWDAKNEQLYQCFGPKRQLFIIGAGMVSQYLASLALTLNFEVRVCDPREHLLNDFPVADVELISEMPDDAIRKYASDASSAIVALTHDPRIDDMGLMEALQSSAFYIGAMGSSRTSANRRERLLALDITTEQLQRLHAPIGMAIGSKTPPEIAIAIGAELIAATNSVKSAVGLSEYHA